ncbi:MAG TPA: MarR family transcriptional regulator [Dongiaceae bacterium]|jgi:DNA-binding MarR family transcriptional regulator|nr:MarR family transcriptional regulator [Dongiaceae bacterium]
MVDQDALSDGESRHTANILGALAVLIQDRVESAWQSALDLSPMAAAAVVQIDNEPGSSIEQVAGRIGLTHSATVRVIDKLAERGLVEKDRARKDARAQSLKLSKAGKRIAQQLHETRNGVTDDLLSGLDAAQRKALEQAISAILHRTVEPGREADVTCRVCDDRRCTPDICPIRVA